MYDRLDKDTEGADEPEDAGMSDPMTLEEFSFIDDSKVKTEKDLEDYKISKLEEEQVTMNSQIAEQRVQEKARGILMSAGLEQPKERGAVKEKKSMMNWIKSGIDTASDTIKDTVHNWFGVKK
jgi:hypothetical protein